MVTNTFPMGFDWFINETRLGMLRIGGIIKSEETFLNIRVHSYYTWKTRPREWEMEEMMEVMPMSATKVSLPRIITSLTTRKSSLLCASINQFVSTIHQSSS
jgi:hypothetical protein